MIINFDGGNGGGGSYVLPVASASVLGGVKVGSGLTIDSGGTLSSEGSADIEELSATTEDIYNEIFYEDESGDTQSQINDLWDAVDAKQDALEAGSGISISDNQISVDTGDSLGFDPDGHLQVEIGAGMDRDEDDALTLKIGSGLAFSGNTLIALGGGSGDGGDYKVVEELPESGDTNGQLFYVPEHSEIVNYYVYEFDCENASEGYVVEEGYFPEHHLYWAGAFYWDWDNGADDWTDYPDNSGAYYKIDGSTFYAAFSEEQDFDEHVKEDVTLTTGTTGVTIHYAAQTYRYIDDGNEPFFRKEYTRAELNSDEDWYEFISTSDEGYLKTVVFTWNGEPLQYYNYNSGEDRYEFAGPSNASSSVGPPEIRGRYSIYVYSDRIDKNDGYLSSLPIRLDINLSNSGITSPTTNLWARAVAQGEYGVNPIVADISNEYGTEGYTENCWFRQVWDTDNSDWAGLGGEKGMIFGAEWFSRDKKYTVEWFINEWGEAREVLNWTEVAAHSAQDSTPSSYS